MTISMAATQDIVAIAVAAAAAAWLAWRFRRGLGRPTCGKAPPRQPGGADGFVPIDRLETRLLPGQNARNDP